MFGGLNFNATLSDVAEITMGQSPAGSSYNEEGAGIIFYQGRGEFGWRFPKRRLYTTEPKRLACEGDVLMSVRAPVGDLNVAFENCCIGRGLAAIHSETPSFALYLMRFLKPQLEAYNGEGTVFGSINGKALKSLEVALPSHNEVMQFESFAAPIDALIRSNENETRKLNNLRNYLLPKLMSGEIDVSKVDLTQLTNNQAFRCLVWVGLSGGDGAEVEFAAGQVDHGA
ncbi:restriction endonuclease subunit S, partial [Bifidobacterium longum]|uniref:restriction endonuclease subunit S n=1 Tax=Bifidobacterium longum TaxID=216816 RepID=UPI000C2FF80F